MKKTLLALGLLVALLAPTSAFAAYVCEATYFPGVSRVRAVMTTGTNCTGTTTTLWFCEATSASTSCANGSSFRYQVPELVNLHRNLSHAADSQQTVFYGTASCVGGGTGCGYYVNFRY